MVISKLITIFTEQLKTITMEMTIDEKRALRDRNQYERNMLRSELCVMVHVALNKFKCVNVPGRKPTKEDVIHVLSNIISSKTRV